GACAAGEGDGGGVPPQRDAVEEAQRVDVDVAGRPGEAAILDQVDEEPLHLTGRQAVRAGVVEAGELRDRVQVAVVRRPAEAAHGHVPDHLPAERGHRLSPRWRVVLRRRARSHGRVTRTATPSGPSPERPRSYEGQKAGPR